MPAIKDANLKQNILSEYIGIPEPSLKGNDNFLEEIQSKNSDKNIQNKNLNECDIITKDSNNILITDDTCSKLLKMIGINKSYKSNQFINSIIDQLNKNKIINQLTDNRYKDQHCSTMTDFENNNLILNFVKENVQRFMDTIPEKKQHLYNDSCNYLIQYLNSIAHTQSGYSLDNEVASCPEVGDFSDRINDPLNSTSDYIAEVTFVKELAIECNELVNTRCSNNHHPLHSSDLSNFGTISVDKDHPTNKMLHTNFKNLNKNDQIRVSNTSSNELGSMKTKGIEFPSNPSVDKKKFDTENEKDGKFEHEDLVGYNTKKPGVDFSKPAYPENSSSNVLYSEFQIFSSPSLNLSEASSLFQTVVGGHDITSNCILKEMTNLESKENDDCDEFLLNHLKDCIEGEKIDSEKEAEDKPDDFIEECHSEESEISIQNNSQLYEMSSNLFPESLPIMSDTYLNSILNSNHSTCYLSSKSEHAKIKSYSLKPIFSLDSSISRSHNRLSQEFFTRNFCWQCNIIASRQTNMLSFSVLNGETFSHKEDIKSIENKACNLITPEGSIDLNVCNISVCKKYTSKVMEIGIESGSYVDLESESGYQESCISFEKYEMSSLMIDYDNTLTSVDVKSSDNILGDFELINDSLGGLIEESDDNFKQMTLPMHKFNFENVEENRIQALSARMSYTDNSSCHNHVDDQENMSYTGDRCCHSNFDDQESMSYTNDRCCHFNVDDQESKSFTDDRCCHNHVDNLETKEISEGSVCAIENMSYHIDIQKQTENDFECEKVESKDICKKTDYMFGKKNDPENTNINRNSQDDKVQCNFEEIRDLNIKSQSKDYQQEDIKYKSNGLQKSESTQEKEQKQQMQQLKKDMLETHLQSQCQLEESKRKISHYAEKGVSNDENNFGLKQDRRENIDKKCLLDKQKVRQENEIDKKHGFSCKVFPNAPKKEGCHRYRRSLNKSKKNKKIFMKMSGPDICNYSAFANKFNRNGRRRRQRNYTHFKWSKSVGNKDIHCRRIQYYQINIGFMKNYPSKHLTVEKGNTNFNGDHHIRLLVQKGKVRSHSGGESGNGGTYNSSCSGSQGNQSSGRSGGGARQNSNRSGGCSGGDGNDNNSNNNNNLNKCTASDKNDSKKNIKSKKKEPTKNLPETPPSTSPSLPPPQLDPEHLAERENAEIARQFNDPFSATLTSFLSSVVPAENTGLEASFSTGTVHNLLSEDNEEISEVPHAAISVSDLCDILGEATRELPPESSKFRSLNQCLTPLIHDLRLAANDDNNRRISFSNCCVCAILSQMLIHQADPEHDGIVRACERCSQIFNLIMLHCIGCILANRPKTRDTQADLCYKICKYVQWNILQLNSSVNKLKGKVLKYCDKVLGSITNSVPGRNFEGDTAQGIGEIGPANLTDIPSTGLSSSTTLSLSGNIVTTETGDQEEQHIITEEVQANSNSATRSVFPNVAAGSSASSGTTAVKIETSCHMKVTRKSSQKRPPAIPPSIIEENQQFEFAAAASSSENIDDGKIDDIEHIIYERMAQNSDQETQKTYGEASKYVSLPYGNIHDGAQFLSVSTRPMGVPGVGEVVFAHPSQLRKVASFWNKKRDECEQTKICPYQHREEGVILAEQKENFGILHTRYQKHQQWERVSHLGNGMSGKCHLCIDLKTEFKFCCKKIHLLRYSEEELSLWSEMHNAYVVRLYGAIRHGVKIYIFSEFIDGGSLAACIEEQKLLGRRLSHWSAMNYFQQLLKVLAFFQKKNILHEDIKADNILLRRNSTFLAVTDFGTSLRLQDPKELKNKSPVGSQTHWSPEKASMEGHGFPSDLWAAVCVLVHMLSGEPPWVKRFMQKAAILNFIIYYRSPPMEDVPENVQLVVRDLIEKAFIKDPQTRPSPSELLQHPAFQILEQGRPETYFSTLTSMAHSGVHFINLAAGRTAETQNTNRDESSSNTITSVSSEPTVLFETNVHQGQYQESDSRSDHMNQKSNYIVASSNNNNQIITVSVGEREQSNTEVTSKTETNENSPEEIITNVANDPGQISMPNDGNVTTSSCSLPIKDAKDVTPSKINSKSNQLMEPFDINKLLPQFDELFESGDSQNNQSIKYFLTDNYRATDLSDFQQPQLQIYKPEGQVDEIPNLSIFNDFVEVTGQENYVTAPSVAEFRTKLIACPSPAYSPINFMLSSESDDYNSADLFVCDATDTTSAPTQIERNSLEVETEIMLSPKQSGDLSPTVSTGSNISSSGTSSLQQRKPINLTLNVTGTSQQPSGLPRSQSDIPASSSTSYNEIDRKSRSSTWTQLSTSKQSSTGNTPLSGSATSVSRKTSATSVPSTASSCASQSYFRSSVIEEQEKMFQELTSDLSRYSPTSNDSDNLVYGDNHQFEPPNNVEVTENEDRQDIQTLRNTMLQDIDETQLVGHNLMFYNENGDHLFTVRVETLPTRWINLINMLRQKTEYNHFRIYHMDNNRPAKFHNPINTCYFKVVRFQNQEADCWCRRCLSMY